MTTKLTLPWNGGKKNAYLHYTWSVWLVATLVSPTSRSFSIACISLVYGGKREAEKGIWIAPVFTRTQWGGAGERGVGINPRTISAYGSRIRRRILRSNPQSSRSCHSHRIRRNPAAHRSRSLGYRILDSSSYCSPDSNSDLGLQTKKQFIKQNWYLALWD